MLNKSLSEIVFNQLENDSRITDVEFINKDNTAIGAKFGNYNINVTIKDNVTYEIELGDSFYSRHENNSQFNKFLDFLKFGKFENVKNTKICDDLRDFLENYDYIHFKHENEAYISNIDNERVAKLCFFGDCVKIYSLSRGVECYKNIDMAKDAIGSLIGQRNVNEFDDDAAEDFLKKAYGTYLVNHYGRVYDLYGVDGTFRVKIKFKYKHAFIGIDEYTSLSEFIYRIHSLTFDKNRI